MGCSSSTEGDKDAVRGHQTTYSDQAEDAASMVSGAGSLSTKMQLSVACTDLVDTDLLSKSDPCVVVKMHSPSENKEFLEIGRTEIISNNLNPKFVTIVPVRFRFEEVQNLRFEVYDVDTNFSSADSSSLDLAKQTLIGATECALAQIVGGNNQTWEGVLKMEGKLAGTTHNSKVVVRGEEVVNSNALVEITLSGANIQKAQSCFLRISRLGETGPPMPCYKTEVQKGSPPRLWAPIKLSLQLLADGDPYRPLLIEAFSWKKSGSHVLLGSCKASFNDIQSKVQQGRQDSIPLDGVSGYLDVIACKLIPQPSFVDYIVGGIQISFAVAVDYTASNGDPSRPGTLHYHDPSTQTPSAYGRAISSVGSVLEFFDSDRKFPVFGFGGCPVPGGAANHCFAVNGYENDPEVDGIAGVLDAYTCSLNRVKLSGPTLFAPIISKISRIAEATVSKGPFHQQYTILLLVTDGAICDMESTIEAIVRAADYPMSIVIVGVGPADFTSMEKLDGDDVRLVNHQGKKAARDIVQFVPMRDLAEKNSHVLAKEVLAEIPQQVIEYMKANNILPGTPKRVTAPSTPFTPIQPQQQQFHGGDAPPMYAP